MLCYMSSMMRGLVVSDSINRWERKVTVNAAILGWYGFSILDSSSPSVSYAATPLPINWPVIFIFPWCSDGKIGHSKTPGGPMMPNTTFYHFFFLQFWHRHPTAKKNIALWMQFNTSVLTLQTLTINK